MAKWKCPGCARFRTTAFCPTCGEEPLRPRDLDLRDLAGQLARGLSSLDGRLARTFRLLLTRPGALTAAHVQGRRRPYLGPLQTFLLANALFFTVQSLTQFDIFSSPLGSHLTRQDWSPLARPLVAERLAERGLELAAYAPEFDRAAVLNAKGLIILMVLAFVPLLPALFYGARRRFGAHVVFALHFYAFVLILLCVSLLLAEGQLLAGGDGLESRAVDLTLSIFNLSACAAYLWLALPFYGSSGRARLLKAIVLAMAVGAIALGYRFAIFLITLYLA
jgi:uncharacterized protein DUF3667